MSIAFMFASTYTYIMLDAIYYDIAIKHSKPKIWTIN